MDDKELDLLANAIWQRLKQRIETLTPAEAHAATRPELPDEETRYAIWKEVTRKLRLAKDVDLRDFALRYPMRQSEILSAVKLMAGPSFAKPQRGQRPVYGAESLTAAIVQSLAYDVLASRAPIGDDKPVECPDDKRFEKSGSFCHEKSGSEKGDFSCRGQPGKGKDFICTGAESIFLCQRSKDDTKFLCDAQPGTKEKFECKITFDCASKDEGPFVCYTGTKGFSCKEKPEDEDGYFCNHGQSNTFTCEAKARFEDYCQKYDCGPKEFACAGHMAEFLCVVNGIFGHQEPTVTG